MIFPRHEFSARSRWVAWAIFCIGLMTGGSFLFASSATNAVVQYHSRSWQTDEGMPQNIVQAVAQSQDGYMWLGTPQGLARFDGTQFKVFTPQNTPALQNISINALLQAHDGTLWVGTSGGGLTRLKDGVFSNVKLSDEPRGNNIIMIYQAKDESMWVGTLGGLFHQQHDGSWRRFTKDDGLNDNVVRAVCEVGDELWIGSVYGVNVLKNGVIKNRPGISDKAVRVILQDRDGTLWFGMTSGLGCLKDGKFTVYDRTVGLADNNVSVIYEDMRGGLWVGTYGGLSRFIAGKLVTEKDSYGVYFDRVNAMGEDQEGDIWVGARDGLFELTAKQFGCYTRQNGIAHNNIMSVLEDRNGNIWLGTWGGGVSKISSENVMNYNWENRDTAGLTTDLILGLCEDADGSVIVGTDYEGGTFRYKDGKFSRIWTQEQSMVDRVIRVIYRDHTNNVWFGTSLGLILENTHEKFLPTEGIRSILEDHLGNLWVGTQTSLFCRKDGKFFDWSAKENQLHDTIVSLYEDHEGTLWVGTGSTGLARCKNGHLTMYTMKQGLFSDDIFEILEDDRGSLWLSCSRGIYRVSKKNLDDLDQKKVALITSVVFDKADGLESVQCNGVGKPSGWKSHDGRLWFTTAKGLVVTDPNFEMSSNDRPPPVFIEELIADRKPLSLARGAKTLRIPPGHGDLEFHYTGLSFQAPEKTTFKYKLENVDRDWVEVTRRVAYYNNLAPGNYKFLVKACNNDGVWNETGASVSLILEPHFWQTWWFSGSLALLAVALAGGTVRYTTRRHMEQEVRRLEKQNAVEEERIRIARDMHDEIGAKLTKISFLGAMAKRKLTHPDEAGAQIDKMSTTAREVIRALDEIVWAVNPANDTLEHLATYLCRNATEFFENSPTQCQFDIPNDLPAVRLGTDARHNILLATKEALNNILKHAGATNARVQMAVQSDHLIVVISDNGHGFQRNGHAVRSRSERVGSGLTNMQERLAVIGGRCEVESQAGQGTRIVFTVSLKDTH